MLFVFAMLEMHLKSYKGEASAPPLGYTQSQLVGLGELSGNLI